MTRAHTTAWQMEGDRRKRKEGKGRTEVEEEVINHFIAVRRMWNFTRRKYSEEK